MTARLHKALRLALILGGVGVAAAACGVEAQEQAEKTTQGLSSLRQELLARPLSAALGGSATVEQADADAFKQPIESLSGTQRAGFIFGNQMFNTVWQPIPGTQPTTDGLGPVFNREACADCHVLNGRGRPPENQDGLFESILVRLSIPGEDEHGGPNPVPGYGGQLQNRAVEGVTPEGRAVLVYEEVTGAYADGTAYTLRKPRVEFPELNFGAMPSDVMTSPRVANQIVGLGLLESVPVEMMNALADPDDVDGDGISGRVNIVWNAVTSEMAPGRFGWKANVPVLAMQNVGAAQGDMGITSPVFPQDNCEQVQTDCVQNANTHDGPEMTVAFTDRLHWYTQFLAVPAQRNGDAPQIIRGEEIFRDIGCVQCHMPTLYTGANEDFPQLANQEIHPFTDLLLHDMGDGLADGRPDFLASGSEWRTAPLWGTGLIETVNEHSLFLHDGRARSRAEAVLWHGGEAQSAREAFKSMDKAERDNLIAFLKSL